MARKIDIRILGILLAFALIFPACSNNDDGANKQYMTAKVDGVDFAADEFDVRHYDSFLVVGGDNTFKDQAIAFTIENYSGVGTYMIGDNEDNKSHIQYVLSEGDLILSSWDANLGTSGLGLEPGIVVISYDDGEIVEGNFSFEGYNGQNLTTAVISEGKFSAVAQF